jgi:polysaccharide export outer membrane protein
MLWNKTFGQCRKFGSLSSILRDRPQPLLAMVVGLIFGCAPLSAQNSVGITYSTESAPSTITAASSTPLVIGPGDILNIAVFDTPSLSFQDRVDEQGLLRTPIIGQVAVGGLNTEQASRLFEEKLRTSNIMLNPSVTVQDTEFATQGMVVLGQVKAAGTYTLLGPHNLYDALSAAGGVTDTAGPSITITHRHDPEHPEVLAVNSPNFSELQRTTRVYPGDTVFVSKADVIYVIGDIGHPGAYYVQNGKPLTVLNVLALAGGDNNTAKSSQASIVRKNAQGVFTIPIDMNKIKENKAPDVSLMANDILVVPRSGLKLALNTLLPGATIAVVSAVASAAIIH